LFSPAFGEDAAHPLAGLRGGDLVSDGIADSDRVVVVVLGNGDFTQDEQQLGGLLVGDADADAHSRSFPNL